MKILGREFLYKLKPGAKFLYEGKKLIATETYTKFIQMYEGKHETFEYMYVYEAIRRFNVRNEGFFLPSNIQVCVISY